METSGAVEREPLKVVEVEVGHLYRETVRAVRMPRAKLLEIVKGVIWAHDLYAIRDLVLASARTIGHYPVGEWVNARGCGCIVGEMLCAGALHEPGVDARRELADAASLTEELERRAPFYARDLGQFGLRIDEALSGHLRDAGLRMGTDGGRDYEVILFTDEG